MPTAVPKPCLPSLKPTLYSRYTSVSEVNPGPPSVITLIWSNTFNPLIRDKVKLMVNAPEIRGTVMDLKRCQGLAPSICAALDQVRGYTLQRSQIDDHIVACTLPYQYYANHDQCQLIVAQPVLSRIDPCRMSFADRVDGTKVVIVHDLPDETGYNTADQNRNVKCTAEEILAPSDIINDQCKCQRECIFEYRDKYRQ